LIIYQIRIISFVPSLEHVSHPVSRKLLGRFEAFREQMEVAGVPDVVVERHAGILQVSGHVDHLALVKQIWK
jgi:hypothetical protein